LIDVREKLLGGMAWHLAFFFALKRVVGMNQKFGQGKDQE
jgi:hypothetical protein